MDVSSSPSMRTTDAQESSSGGRVRYDHGIRVSVVGSELLDPVLAPRDWEVDTDPTRESAISSAASPQSAATARLAKQPLTHSFTALSRAVRDRGLLKRSRAFYFLAFSGLLLALGGVITGVILLDESWLVLLMAGALGVIFTQFAFLGHEASHRQIFESSRANDRTGRVLALGFVGISYGWWMNKHNRHHANPNKVGKDPDIAPDTISFLPE